LLSLGNLLCCLMANICSDFCLLASGILMLLLLLCSLLCSVWIPTHIVRLQGIETEMSVFFPIFNH
jgi:hypothetical protein